MIFHPDNYNFTKSTTNPDNVMNSEIFQIPHGIDFHSHIFEFPLFSRWKASDVCVLYYIWDFSVSCIFSSKRNDHLQTLPRWTKEVAEMLPQKRNAFTIETILYISPHWEKVPCKVAKPLIWYGKSLTLAGKLVFHPSIFSNDQARSFFLEGVHTVYNLMF